MSFDLFFFLSSKLNFDLCRRAEIIRVGLNMHLHDDIGDASSSLRGSTSSSSVLFRQFHDLSVALLECDLKTIEGRFFSGLQRLVSEDSIVGRMVQENRDLSREAVASVLMSLLTDGLSTVTLPLLWSLIFF